MAGDNWAPETEVVEAGQERNPALETGRSESRNGADLGERLCDKHTGHDWPAREMAGEERLTDGDGLDPDRPAAILELDNTIDEEERVPVRDDGLDLLGREHRHEA